MKTKMSNQETVNIITEKINEIAKLFNVDVDIDIDVFDKDGKVLFGATFQR